MTKQDKKILIGLAMTFIAFIPFYQCASEVTADMEAIKRHEAESGQIYIDRQKRRDRIDRELAESKRND